MKTDVIFYEFIKELPQTFFELIDKPDMFPNLTLEEIEAMLDLDAFKNTRLYESIVAKTKPKTELETKLKLVPKCIEKGMSIQDIAEFLELDVVTIRKYLQEQS